MTPYRNRIDALIVFLSKEEKEKKDNDEWVLYVILSGIGLEVQIWVLMLELKQKKVEPQEVGGAPKLKVEV